VATRSEDARPKATLSRELGEFLIELSIALNRSGMYPSGHPSLDKACEHVLSRLSVLHREVLTLFFLEDMPQEQIAAVLGIPVGTVKSRLHHAKAALRALLEGGYR
jgi:predicted DNA-binding protein (UPF0251 family)